MANINELPEFLRLGQRIPINADWSDVQFVLQEIEQELRSEALAIAYETMANVHQTMADGGRKVANLLRGGKQQKRG